MQFSQIQEEVDYELAVLEEERTALVRSINEVAAQKPRSAPNKISAKLRLGKAQLHDIAANAICTLEGGMSVQRAKCFEPLRRFVYKTGIKRPPKTINLASTAAFIVIGWLAEGIPVSFMFINGGTADTPVQGFGIGLSISAVTIALALVVGYWPMRYFNIKFHDTIDPWKLRLLARTAFFAGMGFLLALVYGGSRFRVTGHHDKLADFSEVPFLQTFNDLYVIQLIAISIVSIGIGLWKGFCGLVDPSPLYSELYNQADRKANLPAEELVENAINSADVIRESLVEMHDDMLDEQADYEQRVNDLIDPLHEYDALVTRTEENLKQRALADYWISHGKSSVNADLSSKRIPIDETLASLAVKPVKDDTDELINDLEVTYQKITADIRTALVAYKNADTHLPSFDDNDEDINHAI